MSSQWEVHALPSPIAEDRDIGQRALERQREDAGRGDLEAIDSGANRIDKIVRNLVDVSNLQLGRFQLGDREAFDLAEAATRAVVEAQRGTTLHAIRVVAAEPARVVADQGRIEQVIANLLGSAVKYSPKGGDVEVAWP